MMATRKIFSTLFLHLICTRAFQKSITLNNTNLGSNTIGISMIQNHVETINDTWHIDPISQYGYDISIEMFNEWGFHPSLSSTITFIIDGYTPNITKTDGEFLLLFGVENKYFSVVIRLEDSTAWKSYPDYKYSKLAINNNIFTDLIMSGSGDTRWNRISNIDQWTNIGHPHLYKIGLEWPLEISITNNPNDNTLHYKCRLPNRTLYVDFIDSFVANKGLNTYIMNDASDGKPFDIYSIQIIYEYMTLMPSISPTMYPTTSDPTLYPTTPSPMLSIPDATINPTVTYEETDIITTIEIKNKHINKKNNNSDIIYIIIIAILCILLCIITLILIKKQCDSNNISSEKYKLTNVLPPDYVKNQLGHSIVNNGSGSNSKIKEEDDEKEDESDSDSDDLYDSAEQIYAQNHTPIGTENDTLKRINIEGNMVTQDVKVTVIPI
eukprot:211694_1